MTYYKFKVHKIIPTSTFGDSSSEVETTFKIVEAPYHGFVGKTYDEDEWQDLMQSEHIGEIIKSSTMYILKEK